MASGQAHTFATFGAACVGTAYFGLDYPHAAIAWAFGGLWCMIVQPDLDQLDNGGYYGLHIMRNTMPVSERFWRLYWMPYALTFKHRSIWTHLPAVGTLIRLIYGGWWFVYFLFSPFGVWFLTAAIAADTLHWIMDFRLWTMIGIFRQ